jgi:hypothetical protein
METRKRATFGVRLRALIIVLVGFCLANIPRTAAESSRRHHRPYGIYIDLNQEFYDALKDESYAGSARTYSNDRGREYLRRIAVSSEFMVKTNLEILQQQERIIRLLEGLEAQTRQSK